MFVKEEIHEELVSISATVGGIPKCNPYEVPENYFNNLHEQVLIKSKSDQLNIISDLQSNDTFHVPNQYFNTLADDIILKIHQDNTKHTPIRFLYKSLAAAVVVGFIACSVYFLTYSPKMIQEKNDGMTSILKSANDILLKDDINNEFNKISENDASEYLLSHGEDLNSALAASFYDESSLPSEEEILYNPSFIDNYLKKLHIINHQAL